MVFPLAQNTFICFARASVVFVSIRLSLDFQAGVWGDLQPRIDHLIQS